MKSALALALTGALTLIGASLLPAQAQDASAVLTQRGDLMKAQRTHLGALGAFAKGDNKPADPAAFLIEHASALIDTGTAMPAVFPKGVDGKTKPAVWDNWADFEAKIKGMQDAASKVVTLAQAGDVEGATKAIGGVGASCQACHSVYRN